MHLSTWLPHSRRRAQIPRWAIERRFLADFAKDGTATHRTGEFIVGWIMDGQAVQDLWIVNPSGTHKDREVYTDLHWFDAKARTWRDEASNDDGKTWKLQSEYQMKRRRAN